jgi:ferredoxin
VRVVVDLERCQGSGSCAVAAPQVFAVGEGGAACVLQAEPPDDQRRRVRRAAMRCPRQAISVEG